MGRITRQIINYLSSKQETFTGLKFSAAEANSTVKYTVTGTPTGSDMKYSYDAKTWTQWSDNTEITLTNVGDYIYVKGNNSLGLSKDGSNYIKFVMTGKIAAGGNINSLLDNNDGSSITVIPSGYCYMCLFQNCSSLTTAPELPATTLKASCYQSMFENCTLLTKTPKLPATTISTWCYYFMFKGCTSLTTVSQLPAITLQDICYAGMFENCTSLTTSPELIATTLASYCYSAMFRGCTSLNNIKLAYTGNFNADYFSNWVDGVSATGDFYYNGTDTTTGTSAIPTGWTIHTF